ncbi:TorF family putative porin [Sphingobium sp. CR2-8]|uniref:TorF family putative porin n=1 Tax=Sphingobium sp. CR2-8 TaxID=1306534 RepID=UPI002DBF371B|nr:TorF family putative porin [Sphingobium sp. CR2-8]MEC3910858.1 TorF family putative porin [Sphingobium sp. CR2-8]
MPPTDRFIRAAWLGALSLAGHAVPAAAQYASSPTVTLEAASDERRRGLSWSDGDPVLRGTVLVPVMTDGLNLDGAATTLWGSDRHGGADAVIDLGATYARQLGGFRLTSEARYHLFPGASHQGYGEVGAGAGFLIGPASLDLFASYAPRQSAIGGDNLYLAASAATAIPGTPFTVSARIGRSSGDVRDPMRASRLRPDGRYWDHGAGIDYVKGRWSAGLRYANSSIDGPGRNHAGARLIGRVGLTL